MAQTAKYCDVCAHKLSPADESPQDKEFFKASLLAEGIQPHGQGPRSREGVCEKCGKNGVVTFYEV